METFLGFRVERAEPDALEAYRLVRPDGETYRLLRVTTFPVLLYPIDRTDRLCEILGFRVFTDRRGFLEAVI